MILNKIVLTIGFISCIVGWLGFFYIAPVTIFCGIFLIRKREFESGFICLIVGLIQLFLIIKPPVSW